MTTKLSKAQESILNQAKAEIEYARQFKDYKDFYYNCDNKICCELRLCIERNRKSIKDYEEFKSNHEEEFNRNLNSFNKLRFENITITQANTKTLEKLEKLGFIKILSIGYVDHIKVLNY